jgi:hypothetical protein
LCLGWFLALSKLINPSFFPKQNPSYSSNLYRHSLLPDTISIYDRADLSTRCLWAGWTCCCCWSCASWAARFRARALSLNGMRECDGCSC